MTKVIMPIPICIMQLHAMHTTNVSFRVASHYPHTNGADIEKEEEEENASI